jgi:amidohydrolase
MPQSPAGELSHVAREPRLAADAVEWRRELHEIPELRYELPRTQSYVANKLVSFGCDQVLTDVVPGAVVATIVGARRTSAVVALRSDMDALPMREDSDVAYVSRHAGQMHACGHDGHMAMLLGAARALTETRDFPGTVVLLFQPAEEGGAGAAALVRSGVFDSLQVREVYALHNWPQLEVGKIALRSGAIMGSVSRVHGAFIGRGGHAAAPHLAVDAVVATASFVSGVQTLISRELDPLESAVISITRLAGGCSDNVLPDRVEIEGTLRTLSRNAATILPQRLVEFANAIAAAHGASVEMHVEPEYPVTINNPACAAHCARAAEAAAGATNVDSNHPATLLAEDFSFMLESRPGALVFLGSGPSAPLHSARYDFNDAAIPVGIRYWCTLARERIAALAE